MGEFAVRNENSATEVKKAKKRKVQDDRNEESDTIQPPTKLRKPQKPMKKSRKTLKREERQQKERDEIFDKYKAEVATYLETWKNDKASWKFNKNVQKWILSHLYDPSLLPDTLWATTLEYFAGSKGITKRNIIDTATKIIEEGEEESIASTTSALKTARANDVIQSIVE